MTINFSCNVLLILNSFRGNSYIKTKQKKKTSRKQDVLLLLGLVSKTRPITAWAAAFNSSATVSCLWRSSCCSAVGVSHGSLSHALLHHSPTLGRHATPGLLSPLAPVLAPLPCWHISKARQENSLAQTDHIMSCVMWPLKYKNMTILVWVDLKEM